MRHLLITAHHHGDLPYLARLHTALQHLKKSLEGQVWFIDTGRAWADEVWICQATENRAPYVVLDAMAYTAAFTDGLTRASLEKLHGVVQMQLIPAGTQAACSDLRLEADASLAAPELVQGVLRLDLPPKEMIRQITLEGDKIATSVFIPVGKQVLPDPTITATIDFVESEARYYQRKKGNHEPG